MYKTISIRYSATLLPDIQWAIRFYNMCTPYAEGGVEGGMHAINAQHAENGIERHMHISYIIHYTPHAEKGIEGHEHLMRQLRRQ